MTNSVVENRPGKRERLIASAADLVHRQGVERPTLAEIAGAADVPPGNVYYYFKTKDELIEAVVDCRAAQVAELLDSLGRRRSPSARLKALARNWFDARDLVAEQGCPLGDLAIELNNRGGGLDLQAAKIFRPLVDWAEDQFRQMGTTDARQHALTLISTVQGAAVLASAFGDPEVLAAQVHGLERWIDSLA
jgi:TetR/AcrR family transcriptional regulator, transcriptional repressor for nem operon